MKMINVPHTGMPCSDIKILKPFGTGTITHYITNL